MSVTWSSMGNLEYHNQQALSSSGLKELAKSPAHFKAWQSQGKSETPSMRLGTLFHMAVLEPKNFEKVIAVEGNRNAKAVQERISALEQEGYTVCKPEEIEAARRMRDSVFSHPMAKELLEGGIAEQSVFWTDEESGATCKARLDYVRPKDLIIVDLKSTSDASEENVKRAISNFKYHWQSAFYLDAMEAVTGSKSNDFVHVFTENEAPYATAVYILEDKALATARNQFKPLQKLYAQCVNNNHWPAYQATAKTIGLPAWAE